MSRRPKDRRGRELAKIHVGKKALGLDDDAYRDLIEDVTGERSAKALDWKGRAAVLQRMRELGFVAKPHGRPRPGPGRGPMIRKVRAMLAEAGRPDEYADAMAKRMFGVETFEWLQPQDLQKLVAALVIDQRRRQARQQERG